MNEVLVSMDYSWIIHRYWWIIHGAFEKPSVCFSRLPPAVFFSQKRRPSWKTQKKQIMKSKFIFFVLISITGVQAQSWKAVEGKIMSQWAKTVNPENAWQEYPRPQFERDQWKNLNGLWDYAILKTNEIKPKQYQGKILVPFSFESPLSGVGKNIDPEDKMWYRKNFELPKNWSGKDVVIHFEAVDYTCAVWVNDVLVGTHKGGFDRFSFNITHKSC